MAKCPSGGTCMCRCVNLGPEGKTGCGVGSHCNRHGFGCHMGEQRSGPGGPRPGTGGGFKKGENPHILKKRKEEAEKKKKGGGK